MTVYMNKDSWEALAGILVCLMIAIGCLGYSLGQKLHARARTERKINEVFARANDQTDKVLAARGLKEEIKW